MKKVFTVLTVLLCAVCVFAMESKVNVSLGVPRMQFITSSASDTSLFSIKGCSLEASYQLTDILIDGLYAEGSVEYGIQGMKTDSGKVNLSNIAVCVGAGYKYSFTEKISAFAHLDFMEDTIISKGSGSAIFGFKAGIGAGYVFDDMLDFTAKIDGTFGFSKGTSASYAYMRIIPAFGATYKF